MADLHDPIVAVLFQRDKHPAAKTLADLRRDSPVFCDEAVPLSEALTRQWDADAHLLVYRVDADATGDEWTFARVAKRAPFVPELLTKGGRITVSILAFDYDLPKTPEGQKQNWAPEVLEAFLAQVSAAPELEPTYFYTTLHGARLLYVLTEPVDHLQAEGLIRGIMRDWKAKGICLDEACTDWTRLYRAPCVLRDGKRTEAEPTFMYLAGERELDPSTIVMAEATADVYAEVNPYNGEQPDPDTVLALLTATSPKGKQIDSDLVKTARTFLQGREAYGVCFEHRSIDVSKGWNNGVTKLVGQTIGMLARQEGVTPEGVYALLYSGLQQLQAEEDCGARATDWFAKGWDLVCRMWANEMAQIEAENRVRAAQVQEAAKTREQLLAQLVAERPQDAPSNPEAREEWFLRRMIASDGRRHHIMRRDGSYNVRPVGDSMLVPMIGELGMMNVIPTTEVRGKAFTVRSAQGILNDCATPISDVWCSSRDKVAYIDGPPGYRVLHIPVHRLNAKLQPIFNKQVDEWLQALGGKKYDLLVDWLAHSLTVSRPICALNLYGAPGTGKGLMAQGLAECFEGERMNDGKVLGRFNLGLLDSPIVRCDEGVPQLKADGTVSVDQAFRSLVSGGSLVIEGKMMNPINAAIFPRIMFTSNDREILRSLIGSRDLTADDRKAIELRLLSIEACEDAQRLLTARGNHRYTAGWVHGDVRSEYVLANHIYWLHMHAKPSPGGTNRLLVEGPTGEGGALAAHFRDDPAHQLGVRILVKALQPSALNSQQRSQLHLDSMGLYFLETLFDASSMETDLRRPASRRVDQALNESGIAAGRDLGRRQIGGRRGRWRHVASWERLLDAALDLGLDATLIEQRIAKKGAA